MKRFNFSIMPARVFSDSRVTLRHMRVLGAICRFLNDSNTCHPSLEAIGKVCAMPRERVSNITRELVSLGYILKTSGGGREKATEYTVLFDVAAPETLTNSDNVSAPETLTNSDNVSAPETLTNSDNVSDLSTDLSTGESSSVNGNLSTDLSTGSNNPTAETLTGLALNVDRFGTKNVDQIGQPKRYLSDKKRVPARASARLSRTQARAVAPAGAGVRGADAPPQNKISRFSEKTEIETGGKVNGGKAPEESKKTITLADLLGTPAPAAAEAAPAPAAPAPAAPAAAEAAPAAAEAAPAPAAAPAAAEAAPAPAAEAAPAPAAPAAAEAAPAPAAEAAPAPAAEAAPAPAAAPARKADAPASRTPTSASTKNTPKKPAIRAPGERTQPPSHTPTLPTKKRAKTPKKGILAPAPSDVPSDVFTEWQALRRANRAGCGAVAVAEAREEARSAGVDFATFLKAWILSGYKGYTAETYKNGHKKEDANDDDAARRIAYEREAAERRRQAEEMKAKAVSYQDFLARHPEYAAKRAAKK